MNPQAKVILASFLFFAMETEGQELTPKMQKYFRKLGWVSEKYGHHIYDLEKELNEILEPIEGTVDLLLLSVVLLSSYYEQMRGKTRLFTPMSWKEINDIQEECIELSNKNTNLTCDVADEIVRGLLK